MVFVDTGAWFVSDDKHLAPVTTCIDASAELLVTSDYCVDETLTLLVACKRSRLVIAVGRFFFEKNLVTIQFVTSHQFHRAWLLFQQQAANGWSFTDCTSKVVIEDLKISTAVALDQHFHQFGAVTVVP